jgi:hypothetical protein
MGKLVRRVFDGDQTLAEWSPSDPSSVDRAAAVFRDEVGRGYVAVRDDTNEPVHELPVDAELVIVATAMGGG